MATKGNKKEDVSRPVIWDDGIKKFAENLPACDYPWLYGSHAAIGQNFVTITAPTLAFAEEIRRRFGSMLKRHFQKPLRFAWKDDGARSDCKIAHTKRLIRLNPSVGYIVPSVCHCYLCDPENRQKSGSTFTEDNNQHSETQSEIQTDFFSDSGKITGTAIQNPFHKMP